MAFARKPSTNRWAHRRLLISPHFTDPQLGPDVKALQRAVNQRIQNLGLKMATLKVDGASGRQTIAHAREVARALGIGLKGPGVSAYVQHLIRHPNLRTPIQRARGKKYRQATIDQRLKITGNKVTGGKSRADRIVAAAMQAAKLYYQGTSHRFYSQTGVTQFEKGITGESPGERSDCSQFVVSMCKSAGAPDPCGSDFNPAALHYTGTIPNAGPYVDRAHARPPCAVLYGPPPHHHVELLVGPGNRTVGHGSPPVDYGDVYMMADPHFVNLGS